MKLCIFPWIKLEFRTCRSQIIWPLFLWGNKIWHFYIRESQMNALPLCFHDPSPLTGHVFCERPTLIQSFPSFFQKNWKYQQKTQSSIEFVVLPEPWTSSNPFPHKRCSLINLHENFAVHKMTYVLFSKFCQILIISFRYFGYYFRYTLT